MRQWGWVAVLVLGAGPAVARDNPLVARLEALGGAPCEMSALTCVTITVPRDHFSNAPETLDVAFAVAPATEPSQGVLLYVVGGPGGSGLGLADSYLSAFDPAMLAQLDVVMFDQRGMGASGAVECPQAQGMFDTAPLSAGAPEAALAAARRYVDDCVAEMANPDLLPFLGTGQAIRDVEAFRQAIGAPKLWAFGESYGTQFVQTYAAVFPEAVAGVILDGTVDLTLSFRDYYVSYAGAAERILERVFAACDSAPDCAADLPGGAAAAHDRLAAALGKAPMVVTLPLGDGSTAARELTGAMLETNAFYALYSPEGRAAYLRALSAADAGDGVPMLRLALANLSLDPATGEGIPDPTWFGAAYYGVTCKDYAEGTGDPAVDGPAVMDDAAAHAATGVRMPRIFFAERLVCALWPSRGVVARPEPYAGGDWPTVVLNADMDPITPAAMAYAVADAAANSHLVVMQGGPHVIWGRGLACPDATMTALLTEGVLPPAKVMLCEQDFVTAHVPRLPALDGPLEAARAVADEIFQYPELAGWDGWEDLSFGCNHGGRFRILAHESASPLAFDGCALWPDVVVDGTGFWTLAGTVEDGVALDITVSGRVEGRLVWQRGDVTEAETVSGTWNGAAFATPRPLP